MTAPERDGFEKWADTFDRGVAYILKTNGSYFETYMARQPEIDALKAEMSLSQASERKAAENNVKLADENRRLKAEVESLRKDSERLDLLDSNKQFTLKD